MTGPVSKCEHEHPPIGASSAALLLSRNMLIIHCPGICPVIKMSGKTWSTPEARLKSSNVGYRGLSVVLENIRSVLYIHIHMYLITYIYTCTCICMYLVLVPVLARVSTLVHLKPRFQSYSGCRALNITGVSLYGVPRVPPYSETNACIDLYAAVFLQKFTHTYIYMMYIYIYIYIYMYMYLVTPPALHFMASYNITYSAYYVTHNAHVQEIL